MAGDDSAWMRAAFARLSDEDREILELRVQGGLSSEEVGRLLGKRPGAIRMAQATRVAAFACEPGGGERCSVTTSSAISWRSSSPSLRPSHRRTASPRCVPVPRRHERATAAPARGPWLAVAAAVVALVGGVVVVRTVTNGNGGVVEFAGTMVGPDGESAPADLRVVATGIGRVVDLDTEALPILPTGELYEVWFVGPGDTPESPNRISAGTFHPDRAGRTDVRLAAAVDPTLFPIVEVTAEPGDGDPRATGPVVLRAVIDG